MLGRVDPQASFWDTGFAVGHLVDGDSFYAKLARYGSEVVTDEDFADRYAAGRGRPSIPPSILMRTVLLALHDGTSDRESARRVRMDLGWKHALGLPLDHPGFHPTTFSVFRSRIVLHAADQELFRRIVARAVQAGVLPRRSPQLVDSSAVLGAGAVSDTYELLRRGVGQLVRAAGEQNLSKALRRKLARYRKESKPRIDWHDPAARRVELGRAVQAADRLLAATAGRPELADAAELLCRLVDQDVDRTHPTAAGRRSSGKSPRTASSASVTPTCATAASPSSSVRRLQAARGRRARQRAGHRRGGDPGQRPDGQVAAALVRQASAIGAAQANWSATWPTGPATCAPRSLRPARGWWPRPPHANAGRFGKHDFTVDLSNPDRPQATCPAGVVATEVRGNGRDHRGRSRATLFFPAGACGPCPLRARGVAALAPGP